MNAVVKRLMEMVKADKARMATVYCAYCDHSWTVIDDDWAGAIQRRNAHEALCIPLRHTA